MPSERVTKILLSKSDMSQDQIEALTEAQAWRLVYSIPTPKRERKLEVCFTGFGVSEKKDLIAQAEDAKLKVVNSVTKKLGILVCGENAGPKKLEKAGAQGATALDAAEFSKFLETGEVPGA